jgi:hypothetical protein
MRVTRWVRGRYSTTDSTPPTINSVAPFIGGFVLRVDLRFTAVSRCGGNPSPLYATAARSIVMNDTVTASRTDRGRERRPVVAATRFRRRPDATSFGPEGVDRPIRGAGVSGRRARRQRFGNELSPRRGFDVSVGNTPIVLQIQNRVRPRAGQRFGTPRLRAYAGYAARPVLPMRRTDRQGNAER